MSGNSHQRNIAETAARKVIGAILKESQLPLNGQAKNRKLGRSSIEAYVFFISSVSYSAASAFGITVSFWLGVILSLGIASSATHLLWSSEWTANWSKLARATGTLFIVFLLAIVINRGYVSTHHPKGTQTETASAIENLAKAVSALRDLVSGTPRQVVFEVDTNRPRVIIEEPRDVQSENGEHLLNADILNLGTATAKAEMNTGGLFIAPNSKKSEDALFQYLYNRERDNDPTIPHNDQAPGRENSHIVPISGDVLTENGTPVTDADRMALYAGTKTLYIALIVTYQDSHGRIYRTESCFHQDDSRHLEKMCAGHNGGT